jgi:hypothetical protein
MLKRDSILLVSGQPCATTRTLGLAMHAMSTPGPGISHQGETLL